jgi:hypothetical protein
VERLQDCECNGFTTGTMRFRLFGTVSIPTWILPSGIAVPVVQARVTLLPELSRGRRGLTTGQYRPHLVLGPQSQRAAIRDGNLCTEKYLGVMFVGGPEAINPGESAEVSLALMYFPEESYDEVKPGATFTIREGLLIVGFGAIAAPFSIKPRT